MSFPTLEFWGPWQRSGKTSLFPGGGPFQPCNPHELCRTLENDGKHAFQISRLATIKCQLTWQVTQLGFPTAKRTTPTAFACLALSSSCVPADPRHLWDLWDLATTRHKPHIPPIHLAYLLVSSDKLRLSADSNFGNSHGAFWQIFQASQYLHSCCFSKPKGPASAFTRMVVACSWARKLPSLTFLESSPISSMARPSQPAELTKAEGFARWTTRWVRLCSKRSARVAAAWCHSHIKLQRNTGATVQRSIHPN